MKKIYLLALLCACTAVMQAQNQAAALSLSLQDAKEYALKHNRSLRSADLLIQKAEAAKWQALATMLPHVDAKLGYTNLLGYSAKLNLSSSGDAPNLPFNGDPQHDAMVGVAAETMAALMGGGEGTEIVMNPYGDLTLQATMAFSGVQVVATRLSKLAVEMSDLSKKQSEVDIKANVTTIYASVLVAEELKKLLEGSRENLQKLYTSTEKLYEVGMSEQTAVDQLSVQLGVIDNAVRSAERGIEVAKNSLRLILGSDSTEIELSETLDDFLATNNAYGVAVEQFVPEKNYSVQLLDKNIALSQKQLHLKQWEYGPTLALFYQYTAQTYFGKDEGFNMTPPHSLGATLSIPIISSGERWSKVRQARFDLKAAELQKEDVLESLLVQEKQLRFDLNSAIETYELQKKNVEVYERIFKNTAQKYELGTVSSTDLTTINNNLIAAQRDYVNAVLTMLTAQVNLQKLLNLL
ncbi:MAG: TolC family protein [Prevotellaceae bacterium]|nr:TolC family protein [Prevotellaceae bacterium]